jgi:molybdate transport system permease protein
MRSFRRGDDTPLPVLVLAVLGVAIFAVPMLGLVVETPWRRLPSLLQNEVVADALWLSLVVSVTASGISALLGVPVAWVLARIDFPGKALVRGLVLLPLVLPPVVGGVLLLLALGRRGFVGEPLNSLTGLVLPFSTWGVIVAVTFVSMPFLIVTVEGAFRTLDTRYEGAASSLGASRWTVMRRVALPLIRPSLIAGLVLAWARALGEFGATITFAGNLSGRTQTLPLAVFVAMENDRDLAIALSLVMVAVSLAVLVALRDRWWSTA